MTGRSKHDRRSIRLKEYDYSRAGAYFVTISAQSRQCLFGKIRDGEIVLNAFGEVVHDCWKAIPRHFLHAALDAFVIMPNHVHGIVVITQPPVGAQHAAPLHRFSGRLNVTPGSLAAIVRSFKSAVTSRINEMRKTPGAHIWQRNYYEHVLRNNDELDRVRRYVADNPLKWEMDQENPAACVSESKEPWEI